MNHIFEDSTSPAAGAKFQALAAITDVTLNTDVNNPDVAFVILAFPVGVEPGKSVNITNAPRDHLLIAVKEWVRREEEALIAAQNQAAAQSDPAPITGEISTTGEGKGGE